VKSRISPDIEKVFEQLLWVVRRRYRIVESVQAHFGRQLVDRVLEAVPPPPLPLSDQADLPPLLDEKEPLEFLSSLAFEVVRNEAATISQLRGHVSVYREHVDEQILFGSRTAGQEAGRSFLAQPPAGKPRPESLSVPEAVQAVFELNFTGIPGEKNHFLMLRSQGGSSAHFVRSPLLAAWASAQADPRFLYDMRCEWVRGILDILSPRVEFHPASAIERGNPFGLEHFYLRGAHAGP
jgi:hypothetical protein